MTTHFCSLQIYLIKIEIDYNLQEIMTIWIVSNKLEQNWSLRLFLNCKQIHFIKILYFLHLKHLEKLSISTSYKLKASLLKHYTEIK